MKIEPIRKEIHTRSKFAYSLAEKYAKLIDKQGNVLTSKTTRKYLQARRIYVHYSNEFQRNLNLPLTV